MANKLNINPSSSDEEQITLHKQLHRITFNDFKHEEDFAHLDPIECPMYQPIQEPCIYMWLYHDHVLRIGRTNDIARRAYQHGYRWAKFFTTRYIPVKDTFDISRIERLLINMHCPVLNILDRPDQQHEIRQALPNCHNSDDVLNLILEMLEKYLPPDSKYRRFSRFARLPYIYSLTSYD